MEPAEPAQPLRVEESTRGVEKIKTSDDMKEGLEGVNERTGE
jgi:hypothetical protein